MPSEGTNMADRRAEPRRQAHGAVALRLKSGAKVAVHGELMDIAESGFRACHAMLTLRPGQEVEFEVAGYPGRARVVWTRILGDQVESGFLILPQTGGGA